MKTNAATLLFSSILTVTACAPMDGRSGAEGGPPRGGIEGSGSAMVIDNLQAQLQKTAEALKLMPTQVTLWDAYQDRVGALMADQMKLQPYRAIRQNAMLQIGQKVETVRNRLAAMEEIHEAAGKLYAVLDENQKTIADQMLPQTVPALYSGLAPSSGSTPSEERSRERSGSRGGPGGGGMGSPSLGGGGFGRM